MFIGCIRLNNMEGYCNIIGKMILISHSTGHLAYAKYARLYLQQLNDCRNWMAPSEFKECFENRKAMIHRFDLEWCGNERD